MGVKLNKMKWFDSSYVISLIKSLTSLGKDSAGSKSGLITCSIHIRLIQLGKERTCITFFSFFFSLFFFSLVK